MATRLDPTSAESYLHALEETENDLVLANALMAGRDIGQIVEKDTRAHILEILNIETTSGSRCEIAHELRGELGGDFGRARAILAKLKQGVQDA